MYVPIFTQGFVCSFFFRLFFGLPASDYSWHPLVTQLSFWPCSSFCGHKKACFARNEAVK